MGEAKDRERTSSESRIIESSEQERAALALFLNGYTPENRHDRQLYDALHQDLRLDQARKDVLRAAKESPDLEIGDMCSAELAEYPTTKSVLTYLLKITDTKMPGQWSRHVLRLENRAISLDAGGYKAPSVKAAEAAREPATQKARPTAV